VRPSSAAKKWSRSRRTNQDRLESAKPDLQSMFKRPGGARAGPGLCGTLRGDSTGRRVRRETRGWRTAMTDGRRGTRAVSGRSDTPVINSDENPHDRGTLVWLHWTVRRILPHQRLRRTGRRGGPAGK
jgi:hypothetical protein